MTKLKTEQYKGFEQGPIRPPSEANSLLIRVTRNCPWNHCGFCPVYKNRNFSLRPVDHIIKDIDSVNTFLIRLREIAKKSGHINQSQINEILKTLNENEEQAFYAALNWLANGMESVFLQDANSLLIKPLNLIKVLEHLKQCFPGIKRITSYARSHTIARISGDDLVEIKNAGLNRIHIGLESGSDKILEMIKKGSTKADHIKAGLKVKCAGMELSEYVMPGLGGQDFFKIHAEETADALNQINPDFIRIRTLAIPPGVPLWDMCQAGKFTECTDLMKAKELLLFINSLSGITSKIVSDHVLNLFEEINGRLPEDQENMANTIKKFLAMEPERQTFYQVGRRLGVVNSLDQMYDSEKIIQIKDICNRMRITPQNVDDSINKIMQRFI